MRKERYQKLIPLCVDVTPHTLGLSLSSPLPTQVVVPSPRPMDTARAPSSLRGLGRLQPMGPGPIPGTSGSPSPSHRLQRQGGWGGEKEKRDSLAGGARRAAAGGGGRERSGKLRGGPAGGRGRGRLSGGSGGDKFSGPAAAPPLTWVPEQAPRRCLRRSVGPPGSPRASGPRSLGLGPRRPGPAQGGGAGAPRNNTESPGGRARGRAEL